MILTRSALPLKLTNADWILFASYLIFILGLFYLPTRADSGPPEHVRIFIDQRLFGEYALAQVKKIKLLGALGPSVIEIKRGKVRFLSSACSSKHCVHQGWHQRSGDFGACLPNRVAFELKGGMREYDAVNY